MDDTFPSGRYCYFCRSVLASLLSAFLNCCMVSLTFCRVTAWS